MAVENSKPRVTLIGAGMIVHDQLLPSLYQLQRRGAIGEIHICGTRPESIRALQESETFQKGFPGQRFMPWPDPAEVAPGSRHTQLYKGALAAAPKHSIAFIAVPDQLHHAIIMEALKNDLHTLVVKPLVLTHAHGREIAAKAYERGLFVGVEYHKRFDHRALMARTAYRAGRLGEFRLAQAQMHEPWYYRDSNFQNWFTCENSDMFTYVGCHYVDQIAFMTGLRPVSVSTYGIADSFPNGKQGYLWTDSRVVWENGASLNVVNAMGAPNAAAGANFQGLAMWGQGPTDGTMLVHDDQFRGVTHSYTEAGEGPGATMFAEPNPDYMQLLDQGGGVLTPVGYGVRSVEALMDVAVKAAAMEALDARRGYLQQIEDEGIIATPANSAYNELVVEAARMSIQSGGREAVIEYEPAPRVHFREY